MGILYRILVIFVFAFVLNALWEFWHQRFYVHYQGESITSAVLLRASLVDALMISLLSLGAVALASFGRSDLVTVGFLVVGGFVVAVLLEWWALSTSRWAYKETMILIPLLKTGLTPTIQLGLLGSISWFVSKIVIRA